MSVLDARSRNDVLRITLTGNSGTPMRQIPDEFGRLIREWPSCQTVIVNLDETEIAEGPFAGALRSCWKQTLSSGRHFRLNGVSQCVNRAWQLLGEVSEGWQIETRTPVC